MPKMQEKPQKVDRSLQNFTTSVPQDRTRVLTYNQPKPVTRDNPAIYVQDSDIDLKIKILSTSIADNYMPLALGQNEAITPANLIDLADTAYIYIDNNGKPVKVLASTVLRTEINWDDLSATTQQKIQQLIDNQRLEAGDNITIDGNVISADVGVKTLNGKSGNLTLTANDLNVYTKDDTYNKDETYSKPELQDMFSSIIVDGGRIGE